MREVRETAIEVAAWMEANQAKSLRYAGPFGPAVPLKSEIVSIQKGAVIYSTNPSESKQEVTLTRGMTVRLRAAHRGYLNTEARPDRGEKRVVNSTVAWSGAGSYLRWTDASNVAPAKR